MSAHLHKTHPKHAHIRVSLTSFPLEPVLMCQNSSVSAVKNRRRVISVLIQFSLFLSVESNQYVESSFVGVKFVRRVSE